MQTHILKNKQKNKVTHITQKSYKKHTMVQTGLFTVRQQTTYMVTHIYCHCKMKCSKASLASQIVRICLPSRRHRFDPWVGKIPWRRKQQPTPEFLLVDFHEQRSLVVYS